MSRRFLLGVSLAILAAACMNPVHSDAVDALGPEVNGERPGPFHRAGQPCLTCHGPEGPEDEFAVAGTVFEVRGGSTPLAGVTVALTDSTGAQRQLVTNSAGNFYLRAGQWTPSYPMHVELSINGETKKMVTRIGRNGGCAECHRSAGDTTKMPAVYMRDQ